jgi:hypothetical protein
MAEDADEDIFIPITQAADPEGDLVTQAIRTAYRDVLPVAPGVSAQLRSQSGRAMGTVRQMALEQADPVGTVVGVGATKAPQETIAALKDAFDKEYQETVGSYVLTCPMNFRAQVEARIKQALPEVDNETLNSVSSTVEKQMQRYSSGKPTIDGNNLLNAKNETNALYRTMRGPEKSALKAGVGVYDNIINAELSPAVQGQQDLARYQAASESYPAFKQVRKAVKAAQGSAAGARSTGSGCAPWN